MGQILELLMIQAPRDLCVWWGITGRSESPPPPPAGELSPFPCLFFTGLHQVSFWPDLVVVSCQNHVLRTMIFCWTSYPLYRGPVSQLHIHFVKKKNNMFSTPPRQGEAPTQQMLLVLLYLMRRKAKLDLFWSKFDLDKEKADPHRHFPWVEITHK